jgi:hypothetical protein
MVRLRHKGRFAGAITATLPRQRRFGLKWINPAALAAEGCDVPPMKPERSEKVVERLDRGLSRSRAVLAEYRARLLLLRQALQAPPARMVRAKRAD